MVTAKKTAGAKKAGPAVKVEEKKLKASAVAASTIKPAAAPVAGKPAASPAAKPEKAGKEKHKKKKDKKDGDSAERKKLVRDSFTMPTADYALIGELKVRALASGAAVKKSELLRAGLIALAQLPSPRLLDLITALPKIKTGRPGKKA